MGMGLGPLLKVEVFGSAEIDLRLPHAFHAPRGEKTGALKCARKSGIETTAVP